MSLYRVKLRGENFLVNMTGEPELLGFDVTHFVDANSEEEACRIATILVRKNRQLHDHLLNPPQNPSRIACESAKRVWWQLFRKNGHYQFWPADAPEDPAPPTDSPR